MAIEIMFPSTPLPPPRRFPLWLDTRVSDAQRAALDFERITREAARRFQTARVPRREGSPEAARESLGVGSWRGTERRIESREDRVVETDERGMLEVFTTTNGTRWQRAELSARDRERTDYPAPITPDAALEVAARYIERFGLEHPSG